MTDEKELLGDSMDMFSHGNDTINRTPAHEAVSDPVREEAAPAQADADRARDEQGRFAPKEAAKPNPAPQAPTIPPVAADVDPEKQPISRAEFKGMLEWRDKAQRAEARAAELERQFQSQQKPPQIPSFQDNPEAFAQYLQQERTSLAFDMSETMAREKHGDEPVSKAMEWALQKSQQSPAFAAEYLKQKHPIDWAVKQQKRNALLDEIGDDVEAYKAKLIASHSAAAAPPQPQAAQPSPAASPQPASQQPQTPAPSRSIANATSAGGGVQVVPPSGEFAAIDGMFNR